MLYRRSGGRLGNTLKGAPILLLDHVGRKSGQTRTAPVLYLRDGEDLVIVASRGGSDATPAWWLNLQANPATTVQVGSERRLVLARQASAQEKAALWPRLVEMYGDFEIYQRRTEREIPVVILSRPGRFAARAGAGPTRAGCYGSGLPAGLAPTRAPAPACVRPAAVRFGSRAIPPCAPRRDDDRAGFARRHEARPRRGARAGRRVPGLSAGTSRGHGRRTWFAARSGGPSESRSGVSITPGQTALTRTPCARASRAGSR